MQTIILVYIGNKFYHESGTVMSSIYKENGERYNWGLVSVALEKGNQITIRQATPKEKEHYKQQLAQITLEHKD